MRALIAILAVVATPALGQGWGYNPPTTHYDWQSGNTYTVQPRPNGGAHVNGFNSQTGSTWSQTIQPDGSASGFDSRGNSWSYDQNTGNYYNFGTGRTCFGKGALRTCY